MVYCIQRRDEIDLQEFGRDWSKEIQLNKNLGRSLIACRCVYSRTILPDLNDALRKNRPGMQPPYEGMLEFWWKSPEDLKFSMSNLSTAEARAASERFLEDEKRIVDASRSRIFVTEEHVIF